MSRIWNYDETNLSDDPGQKKVICKRGTKYLENICNTSKSSTSLMFCGNAEGRLLAPYVAYKADHMWSTWTENGPEQARYNQSKSSWFDANCFEDWFERQFLPEIRRGKQPEESAVLIGDNLSSHISYRVLELCEQHNIQFVCLSPNVTHIAQPPDVAFFGPMKRIWRSILSVWKETKTGSRFTTIPKDVFPSLLKQLMVQLNENQGSNLISGFRKCGIYPFNKEELVSRLPNNENDCDKGIYWGSIFKSTGGKKGRFSGNGQFKTKKKEVTSASRVEYFT